MSPAAAASREEVFRLCAQALKELGSDVGAGCRLADEAYRMAKLLGDAVALAESLRAKGHTEQRAGHYKKSARSYQRAVRLLDSLGDEVGAARARSSASNCLMYLGRLDEALAWADLARQSFVRHKDTLRLARLETNVGNVLQRQERHTEALAAYERALASLQDLADEESAAITLRNMAVVHVGMLHFEHALACFEEARAIFHRRKQAVLAGEVDDNIAYLHFLEGDYRRAIVLYEASRSREGQNPHKAAISLLDQSDLYLELNLFREAAHLASEAAARFSKLGLRPEIARSLQNLGLAHLHLGNLDLSLRSLRRVRILLARQKNSLWTAINDLSLALALTGAGRADEALALVQAARTELQGSSLVGKAVLAAVINARLELRRGRTTVARTLAAEARSLIRDANAPHLLLSAHLIAAEAAYAEGDRQVALTEFLAAHARAEDLRQRLGRDELQLSFLEDKRAIYEGLVALHLERNDAAGAFEFVEHAKSRSLADSLTRAPLERAGVTREDQTVDSRRTRLRRLYRRLDQLEARPQSTTSPIVAEFRLQAGLCERELSAALAGRSAVEPESSGSTPTIGVAEVQANLAGDAAFLHYFHLHGRIALLAIRRDALQCFDLGASSNVATECRLLRFQLSRGGLSWANANHDPSWLLATNRHLEALYRLLIEPAAHWLPTGQWTIAPHDGLHRVPFHAFGPPGRSLVEDHNITYAPSAGVWLQCLARRPAAEPSSALVLGVPDENSPLIAVEAESVARLFLGSELYIGPEATLERLGRGAGHSIVHIASHGVFRADNPAFSALRLADTRLILLDLRELPLACDLITLSGCATGVQESAGADEVLGLARGALLAGARAAQVSLWPVNDESTTRYMVDFYRALAAGSRPADALRIAMLKSKLRDPHPFYWAPFALTGAA